jgi:quercetin dioxygenase-like cupin family protein
MTYRILAVVAAVAMGLVAPGAWAQQPLDQAAISITVPDDIDWVVDEGGGSERAILYGDPGEAGPYGYFIKWKAGNFSRPHSHPNDRYIIVVSGTWWVGTGAAFEPETSTVPLSSGTFVVHHGSEIHYDGARDDDAVMLIQGTGPATSTPAPAR